MLHACRSILPQKSAEGTYEYLQLSARLHYQDQQTQYTNAYIRIRIHRDKIIWFSVTNTWGIEALRGTITPTGITILNHLRKEYYTHDHTTLSTQPNYHSNYTLAQAILLGELLPQLPQDTTSTIIQQHLSPWTLTYTMDRAHSKPQKLEALDNQNQRRCTVTYKAFKQYTQGTLHRQAHIVLGNTTITLNRIKARWPSKPLQFPIQIPAKYAKE